MNDLPLILIIVVDTLRKDYSKPIKELVEKYGFLSCDNAVASAPWTLPSHASMFTGLYPSMHKAHETLKGKVYPLKKKEKLLTNTLTKIGYRNTLLTANVLISPELGFQGFHRVFERPHLPFLSREPIRLTKEEISYLNNLRKEYGSRKKYLFRILGSRKKLFSKILLRFLIHRTGLLNLINFTYMVYKGGYIEKGSKEILKKLEDIELTHGKHFIFINFMEVHEPYSLIELIKPWIVFDQLLLNGKVDKRIIKKWRESYPRQVLRIKNRLKQLFDFLIERNIFDKSLIIVTSDHGQLLGEYNDIVNHIAFLYDELLSIPLFIKFPEKIEYKEPVINNKWFSNIKIKELVLDTIRSYKTNRSIDLSKFYYTKVFAESFGVHSLSISKCINQRCRFLEYSKRRVAIYKNKYKLVLNITDNTVEEAKNYDGGDIEEHIIADLKKDIYKYLIFTEKLGRITKIV